MKSENVVVIGAGQSGFSVCSKLREQGFEGQVTLIGEEMHLPYQRPPLSKAYLLGEIALDGLFFRSDSFYAEADIKVMTGAVVTHIDTKQALITLEDLRTVTYDTLVLATGSSPIRLPAAIGGNLAGVFYMRDLADADCLAQSMKTGKRALIVGGGYIGLEAAAVAVKCGVQTTLVEASDRILQRVASAETSDYFRTLHKGHGVTLHEGVSLQELIGENGQVTGARLSDGSVISIDFLVAGIGVRPNTELAEEAGLRTQNGIAVNQFCETSVSNVLAAGDCASFPHGGGYVRLESVGNAVDMGEIVAQSIMGSRQPYQAKPWFWSDQYNTKLQIVGMSEGYDEIITRRTDDTRVSFWYYAKDHLLAVDAMNDPRAYMVAKRLIESGKTADKIAVGDPETNLKSLLKG